MSTAATTRSVGDLAALLPSWARSLRAERKSPRTVQSYLEAGDKFLAFLTSNGMPAVAASIRREHVESFIEDVLSRYSPATAANRYRSLQQLFRWLVDEGEIEATPMARMRPPKLGEAPVQVLTDDEIARLFDACKGNGFEARRDTAILRLFLSTGARLAEITGLRLEDVDLDGRVAYVTGKGDRGRHLPLTPKTIKAIDRYLRVRATHVYASEPCLWLGARGRLRESGVQQMFRRRSGEANVEHLHPHRFRHTYAHRWLSEGGSEGDLMRLAGWRSRDMLGRYGASAADQRARDAHAFFNPGDHL